MGVERFHIYINQMTEIFLSNSEVKFENYKVWLLKSLLLHPKEWSENHVVQRYGLFEVAWKFRSLFGKTGTAGLISTI